MTNQQAMTKGNGNGAGASMALVTIGQAALTLADCKSYGELLAQSGFFEGRTPAQCAVLVMAGAEIGVPPFAAMQGIHMIKGRPFVGAHILAAKVKASGRYDYRVPVSNETECVIEFVRVATGEIIGTSTYTFAMAQKARLGSNDNYQRHTADMLYARAMTRGAKRFCPDVINGMDIAVDEPQAEPERAPLPAMTQTQRVDLLRGPEDGDVLDADPLPLVAESVAEPGIDAAPAAPVEEPAPANGKTKPAKVQAPGNDWQNACAALAQVCPYWQDKAGKPSYYHIVGAAGKLGYEAITPENLGEVMLRLEQYAAQQADQQAQAA